jgi:NADH:ubiquinone reductase (H+-translocating)
MPEKYNNNTHSPHRILIIGCGFGGLEAARALRHANVAITIVDKTNHHLFQPLLYQVATAGLAAPAIAAPIRHILRKQSNVTVIMGEVVDIDVAAKHAVLAEGKTLAYDSLIVAAGAKHSYFGHDDWAAYAPGLKTLEDAFDIRRTLLLAFEKAEADALNHAPHHVEKPLIFAVIGAGPTGVEMAGTMAEIAHHTLPDEFRRIEPAKARVLLIEGGPRVLPSYSPDMSDSALAQLKRLKVEVLLQHQVTAIDAQGVTCKVGDATKRIETNAVVWAAGVAASPLGKSLAQNTGAELDRAGRVIVQPDLSLLNHLEISVIGDLAFAKSYAKNKEPSIVPGVSPGAKQMGRTAAANIIRRMKGEVTQAFVYKDYGALATIGRKAAIVEVSVPLLGTFKLRGLLAWLFWLFVHIYFLIGFRNRFRVFADWAWAYLTFQRSARIVVGEVTNKKHA